jgi:DNA-directed RNA polymerase subunit RPC12/RpoP
VSYPFASGKWAIAICDRCGQQFKLKNLKTEIIKTKKYDLLVCPECWDPDHPQLQLGMYPVNDPQALRNPRRDTTYQQAGLNGLQLTDNDAGDPTGGSRIIQWGWNPVGMARSFDADLTPNYLFLNIQIGTVTVVTT